MGETNVKAYLTAPETAECVNVSERFVRRVIAQRRIPFHYVGGHIWFVKSDMDEWLVGNRVEPLTRKQIREALLREVS